MGWLIGLGCALVLLLGGAVFARAPATPPPQDGVATEQGAIVVYSPGYRVSFFGFERLHPFDIAKYDRIARHLQREGLVAPDGFAVPPAPDDVALAAVHDPEYLASLTDPAALSGALEVPVPRFFSPGIIERRVLSAFRRAVGGTLVAAEGALSVGLGVNLGGGFHHARPAEGHGFCVYNDVAYAIAALRARGFGGQILIVDTDAHQGDGNHAFFQGDPSVFSFSMHQGSIFPVPKLRGNRDTSLKAGTDDDAFLGLLDAALSDLLEQDDYALVFHVAGSDVLRDDPLAGLALTPEGLVRRDLMVTRHVRSRGVPLVHLLAGGYGPSSADAQARAIAAILRGEWRSERE